MEKGVKMKVYIKTKYYKQSKKGREPAKYHATQKGGVGHDVHATVMLDPVLKKHPDLKKAILKHEQNEIKSWGKGETASHSTSKKKEPALTRNIGGVSGFWSEIKRREKMKNSRS